MGGGIRVSLLLDASKPDCDEWIMEIRQKSWALIRNLLVLVMKCAVEARNEQAGVNQVEKLERLSKFPSS